MGTLFFQSLFPHLLCPPASFCLLSLTSLRPSYVLRVFFKKLWHLLWLFPEDFCLLLGCGFCWSFSFLPWLSFLPSSSRGQRFLLEHKTLLVESSWVWARYPELLCLLYSFALNPPPSGSVFQVSYLWKENCWLIDKKVVCWKFLLVSETMTGTFSSSVAFFFPLIYSFIHSFYKY